MMKKLPSVSMTSSEMSEDQFVYIYKEVIDCYPNYMTCFYFPFALDQIAATAN